MSNSTLQKKLAAYSALATTAMFANQADAQVIYTDVDPDFIITEPADPPYTDILVMDINMDSSPEGTFAFSSFLFDGSCYTAGSMSFYFINYASVLLNDTSAGVRILNEGEWINSSGNWNNDVFQQFMFSDFFNNTCDSDLEYPVIGGNWRQENEKYMGIRFYDAAADLHYGYIRLTVLIDSVAGDAEVELIKVYGYAWESSADTPIMAGDGYQPDAIHDLAVMELQIWPNPTSELLYVDQIPPGMQQARWLIHDLAGRLIRDTPLNGPVLSVADLQPGVYLLSLQDGDQPVGISRFIKQ